MRILVLGGDGMLGHRLFLTLKEHHDVRATLKRAESTYGALGLFNPHNSFFGIDLRRTAEVERIVEKFQPDAIINAAGIVKQREDAADPIISIQVNSLLPHQLCNLASNRGARLIHVSTDCVFSGRVGNYSEDTAPDPVDTYGRTKLLGEITDRPNCLTLRTSIVGRELAGRRGLLEWFLAADCPIPGFAGSIFSGLTTHELSRVIEMLLVQHPDLSGLYHVSSDPIDKLSLLMLFRDALRPDCDVVADTSVSIDRSLDHRRFYEATGYRPSAWPDMVAELRIPEAQQTRVEGK